MITRLTFWAGKGPVWQCGAWRTVSAWHPRVRSGASGEGGDRQGFPRPWPVSPSSALPWGPGGQHPGQGEGMASPCGPLHPPLSTQQGSCVLALTPRPGSEPTAPGPYPGSGMTAATVHATPPVSGTLSPIISFHLHGYPGRAQEESTTVMGSRVQRPRSQSRSTAPSSGTLTSLGRAAHPQRGRATSN